MFKESYLSLYKGRVSTYVCHEGIWETGNITPFILNNTMTYSYNKNQQGALFLNFILVKNSTSFGQIYCPS